MVVEKWEGSTDKIYLISSPGLCSVMILTSIKYLEILRVTLHVRSGAQILVREGFIGPNGRKFVVIKIKVV